MGSDRKWIYLTYLALAGLCAWVLNKVLLVAVGYLRVRNPMILGVLPATAVISIAAMALAAYFYFRQPKVNTFSEEVVSEVKKVTWPARKTTSLSTVVVLITVMVMAVILGFYDWICAKAVSWVLGL